MISSIFNLIFYGPLYNGLVFLVDLMPGHDLGFAIVALTILVRFILLPLQHRSVVAQRKMKEIEPHLRKIKDKFKENKEEQAKQTMNLYREHGINPFSGFLMLLLQFPIIIALFLLIRQGLVLKPEVLYSFVSFPDGVNTLFLGLIEMTKSNYVLAILAGVSQYIQIHLSIPKIKKEEDSGNKKRSFGEELQRSMSIQTKYIMPVIVIFIAMKFSSGLALYWTISNSFAIVHEIIVSRKAKKIYDTGTDTNGKTNN